jgi:BON domain
MTPAMATHSRPAPAQDLPFDRLSLMRQPYPRQDISSGSLRLKGSRVLLSAFGTLRNGAIAAALFAALGCWSAPARADDAGTRAAKSLDVIVVTAKRLPEVLPDEVVKTRVETALHDDPYFYDEHVTVTVKNGVVHLQGIVFDAQDMQSVRRIIRKKVSGVKRLVNELEICSCDGGGSG